MISSILLRGLFPATVVVAVFGAATAFSPSTSSATAPSAVSAYVSATSGGAYTPHSRAPRADADSVGVYTAAQAERGKAVYTAVCAECHELEDFTHEDFRFEWNGVSLYEFFETIRTTMPDENPGTLMREQYVDVVTYVLKLNDLPEGPEEFTADSATASGVILNLPPRGEQPDSLR